MKINKIKVNSDEVIDTLYLEDSDARHEPILTSLSGAVSDNSLVSSKAIKDALDQKMQIFAIGSGLKLENGVLSTTGETPPSAEGVSF